MMHDDIDDDAEHFARSLEIELPIEPILRERQKPLETLRDMHLKPDKKPWPQAALRAEPFHWCHFC
jgi:hypothetical protein